jgi:hypothetical protein
MSIMGTAHRFGHPSQVVRPRGTSSYRTPHLTGAGGQGIDVFSNDKPLLTHQVHALFG